MKKARVIYNPSAGREIIASKLPAILEVYEKAGYETSAFRTQKDPHSAAKEARRCALGGFDLIVAAGGDGTINEVVNGISDLDERPAVAIVPAGTSNDYAHALGVRKDSLVAAAEVIYKQEFIPMDIGKMATYDEKKYFVNIAAAGNLTELTYEVSPQLKSIFGYLAYFAKGAEKLPQIRPVNLRITYDDGIYEGKTSLVFLALTETFGGFDYVAPDKVPGDGKFTLIIVKTSNLLHIASLLRKLMNKGSHISDEHIIYTKTEDIKIENLDGEDIPINLDGDYGGDTPAIFTNLQRHIRFAADVEKMTNSIDPRDKETAKLKEEFIKELENYSAQNSTNIDEE